MNAASLKVNAALVVWSGVSFSVLPLEQCKAVSQLANPAPHIHEQRVSGERHSDRAGAVSCKANAAPRTQSGVLLSWTPLRMQ